jgi:hypothetical protein
VTTQWIGFKQRLTGFLYNLDRAIASLVWGTDQNTISDEVGRIERGEPQVGAALHKPWQLALARRIARWLDTDPKLWGADHTARAIAHADKLDRVDDGKEQ